VLSEPRPLKILVVEDYVDAREMYLEFFRAQGFEALGAREGREALRLAREQRPDVVVLDVALPQMNGYAVLKEIRTDREIEETPVLMLSASVGDEYVMRAREGGANAALTKPLLPDELLQAIREVAAEYRNKRARSGEGVS
jgi:two-component system, cell cycle response regulator DivK